MSVRLPPHKHCPNCEDPIPEDRDYCSQECMLEHETKQRRGSRKMTLFYVAAGLILVLLWAFSFVKL